MRFFYSFSCFRVLFVFAAFHFSFIIQSKAFLPPNNVSQRNEFIYDVWDGFFFSLCVCLFLIVVVFVCFFAAVDAICYRLVDTNRKNLYVYCTVLSFYTISFGRMFFSVCCVSFAVYSKTHLFLHKKFISHVSHCNTQKYGERDTMGIFVCCLRLYLK